MNKIDRINHLLAASIHHRDQLASMAKEFVDLHGEAHGSCEADELMHVIFDGFPYEDALHRINCIRGKNGRRSNDD